MYHAIYERQLFSIENHLFSVNDRKRGIDELRKRADKGGFFCPHCNEALIVRAGDKRDIHFSHSSGSSCMITEASDTYKKQVKRESKKHSVMRNIVHEVLKNQEKIRPDLHVAFGYIAKAEEKWSHFPDIVLQNKNQELAISILTNVDRSKDIKLAKQIKKRNEYYKSKGLQTIWFIEDQEMSIDWDHHVIHLWETEVDLSIKTSEDQLWDDTLAQLGSSTEITDLFEYWRIGQNIAMDTRSLYYIYSTQEGIDFSVHRFLVDEKQFPFRAFALNKGYRMSISTALAINDTLALSDSEQELLDRKWFMDEFQLRKEEKLRQAKIKWQQEYDFLQQQQAIREAASTSTYGNSNKADTLSLPQTRPTAKMSYDELKMRLQNKIGLTQKDQLKLWHTYVLKNRIKEFDLIWSLAEQVDTFEDLEHLIQNHLL